MQVTVKTSDLLEELRKNRGAHRDIFLKAQNGFKAAVLETVEDMLDQARQGKRVNFSVHLPAPIDQTKDYNRAIKMFEMSTESETDLEEHEFAQYVMDDWSWKDQVTMTNTAYLSRNE